MTPGSYRFDEDTEVLRECRMGAKACPGGNGTGDALCARGYEGPLCGVCESGFILDSSGSECIECASSKAWSSLTVPLVVLSVVGIIIALGLFSDVARPLFQFVWHTLGTPSRIVWALAQCVLVVGGFCHPSRG